ncbi:HtaA domain-containing protein [Streptomyces sp. NPDC003038]|uniref:HtaA domain-containing protein n=1 Tax=unclassified Streptomyces TaxID=2593676 RepID=UPI0033AFCC4F
MSSHPRSMAVAAAVITAAALGTTAFVLPATAAGGATALAPQADGAPTAPLKITGGSLDWGVLKDYRDYVTGMAHGTITVGDGATQNADGSFRFAAPTGQYDPAAGHVVRAAFQGSVTFSSPAPPAGHGFEVRLWDIRIDTGTKKLTADVTKGGTTTQDVPLADVAFGGREMKNLATTLTKEAGEQLGSARYAGLKGDDLNAALEFEKPTTPPGTPTPTPTKTPSGTPTPTATKSATATPSKSATPPAQTTAPADGPQQILRGKLTWGVKESLRTYLIGDPKKPSGSITPAGGAAADGTTFSFAFGKGELDAAKRKLTASFQGDLRFQRADHGIDMTFGNVRINAEGDTGTLVLDVKTPAGTKADIPFATLSLAKADYRTQKGLLALNGVRAALTAEGAAAFANGTTGSFYKAGDRVDDVNLSLAVDKDATLPVTGGASGGTGGGDSTAAGTTGGTMGAGSVGGNLASTGADVPAAALLGASGAVIAAGAGAVYFARRRCTPRTPQN